jgi:hypothetical protein
MHRLLHLLPKIAERRDLGLAVEAHLQAALSPLIL